MTRNLSPAQRRAAEALDDLLSRDALVSLADVARIRGISRQATHDAVRRSGVLPVIVSGQRVRIYLRAELLPDTDGEDSTAPHDREAWGRVKRGGGVITTAGLAERWGVTQSRVAAITNGAAFPPSRTVANINLWLAAEVQRWEEWADARTRTGPPRTASRGDKR